LRLKWQEVSGNCRAGLVAEPFRDLPVSLAALTFPPPPPYLDRLMRRLRTPLRHTEEHSAISDTVRDVVLGAADGLTVPFALAAGLAGAVAQSGVVLTAGLAEVAAGAIAMGLGGYLAARSEADHYSAELRRERQEIHEVPEHEAREVVEILESYGLEQADAETVTRALQRDPERWVDFMMRFELGLEAPKPGGAYRSALTIGTAYCIGGLIPLIPYMVFPDLKKALLVSAVATLLALLIFGGIKGQLTGIPRWRSGLQTALTGGVAAAIAFEVARWVGG